LRIAGGALLVGAVATFLLSLASDIFLQGGDASQSGRSLFVVVNFLSVVAAVPLLLGFTAAYRVQAPRAGVLGLIGFVCIYLTGLMFGIFFSLLNAIIIPYVYQNARSLFQGDNGPPLLFAFFISATLFTLIGGVLFGVATLRAKVFPRATGFLFIAAGVLGLVNLLPFSRNVPFLGSLNGYLLFIALAILGYRLWSKGEELESESPD
jgi:hypothetical protein